MRRLLFCLLPEKLSRVFSGGVAVHARRFLLFVLLCRCIVLARLVKETTVFQTRKNAMTVCNAIVPFFLFPVVLNVMPTGFTCFPLFHFYHLKDIISQKLLLCNIFLLLGLFFFKNVEKNYFFCYDTTSEVSL